MLRASRTSGSSASFAVSCATGAGIDDLQAHALRALSRPQPSRCRRRAEELLPDFLVYRPQPPARPRVPDLSHRPRLPHRRHAAAGRGARGRAQGRGRGKRATRSRSARRRSSGGRRASRRRVRPAAQWPRRARARGDRALRRSSACSSSSSARPGTSTSRPPTRGSSSRGSRSPGRRVELEPSRIPTVDCCARLAARRSGLPDRRRRARATSRPGSSRSACSSSLGSASRRGRATRAAARGVAP